MFYLSIFTNHNMIHFLSNMKYKINDVHTDSIIKFIISKYNNWSRQYLNSLRQMNNKISVPSQLTTDLLRILDKQKPSKPNAQNILQMPANTFSIIRQMYNSFKKNNQSRILQDKIYDLKIYDAETNSSYGSSYTQKQIEKDKYKKKKQDQTSNNSKQVSCSNVKLEYLIHSYSKQYCSQLIQNLLILKAYLPPHSQKQLIIILSRQATKIDDFPTVLKLFRKILKSNQCIQKGDNSTSGTDQKKKNELYSSIQKQMIAKLLSFKIQFRQYQTKEICKFLYSLPFLQQQILELISFLFQKINDIAQFNQLNVLYINIYWKLRNKKYQKRQNEEDRVQGTMRDSQMVDENNKNSDIYSYIYDQQDQMLLQSFLRITTQQHLQVMKNRIGQISNKIKNKSEFNKPDYLFINCLQKQAIKKMENNLPKTYYQPNPTLAQGLAEQALVLKQKQKKIIDFIYLVLQCQAFLKINQGSKSKEKERGHQNNENPVWSTFITWHQKCCRNLSWNYYSANKMAQLSQNILEIPQTAINIIKILLDQQIPCFYQSNSNNAVSSPINLNESITNFFIRHLISGFTNYQRYLSNRQVKKLIAYGLMYDQLQIYQPIIINQNNLQYFDIFIEIFRNINPVDFLRRILTNQTRRANLQKYLSALMDQKPKKYKDFFVKVDSYNQGQIFEIQDHYLLKYFRTTASSQIVISFFRDMAGYLPSKFGVQIFKSFNQKFKQKPQAKIIYHQTLRTLNIILTTRNADQLSFQFKLHLKQFVVEVKTIEAKEIFKNVPEKMTNDLSAFYSTLQSK